MAFEDQCKIIEKHLRGTDMGCAYETALSIVHQAIADGYLLSKPNLNEINQRLYYKPLYKPISHDDIKKAQKLTEFVTYNFALNNLFFKKNGIN
jgi:hypothetical protein